MTLFVAGYLALFYAVVALLVRASHHLVEIDWRASGSPTPISPGLWSTSPSKGAGDPEGSRIRYPFGFDPWPTCTFDDTGFYHRVFVQNVEDVDLVGHFVLEISAPSEPFELVCPKDVGEHHKGTAEIMGVRVFAGPSKLELSRAENGIRLHFTRLAAETAWTIEWRLARLTDLNVSLWECKSSEDVEPSDRVFRAVNFVSVQIPKDGARAVRKASRPSRWDMWILAAVAAGLHATCIAFIPEGDLSWISLMGALVSSAAVLAAGVFVVRRDSPPFSQGFLVPSHVRLRPESNRSDAAEPRSPSRSPEDQGRSSAPSLKSASADAAGPVSPTDATAPV
jgi:hypothetical protein